jgi:predicted dehydrogenase
MRKAKVALVGIGGFGVSHLNTISQLQEKGTVELSAVCDKNLALYESNLDKFNFNNIRKYTDYEEFLAKEKALDLVILSTPIPLHKAMSCMAMEAGNNVLLEKPPAVTIQDIDYIIAAQQKTQKHCFVGFQMTSSKSFLQFKEELQSGIIGELTRITGAGNWCRSQGYFTRSPWVGKLIHNGNYVLDGTVNNPFAHLLNNCLLLAGLKDKKYRVPNWVQAELYRSNNIEGEDTSCVRVMTVGNTEVYFLATICSKKNDLPIINVLGTKGRALWRYDGFYEFYDLNNNLIKENCIVSNANLDHLENITNYIMGENSELPCSISDTRDFVLTSNLAFESSKTTHKIAKEYLAYFNENCERIDELKQNKDFIYLKDIEDIINSSVKEGKLFSELGIKWSMKTSPFYAKDYKSFELYK